MNLMLYTIATALPLSFAAVIACYAVAVLLKSKPADENAAAASDKKEDDGATPRADTPYPFNFSTLREGDYDPVLGKKVKWLIDSDDDYIVYIDQDDYVEWTMNANAMLVGNGDLLTRVAGLEAVECDHLSELQIETYERMVGEGVARLFDKDRIAAAAALDAAETWITARNQEAARLWYLEGAVGGVFFVLVPFFIAFLAKGVNGLIHDKPVIVTAALFGAAGAALSVLQRSGQAALDLGAESFVLRREGFARVMSGSGGAVFVALLIRSGYVLPNLAANSSLFFATCIVAGLSERLVTSLANSVEANTGFALAKPKVSSGQPHPRVDHSHKPADQPR